MKLASQLRQLVVVFWVVGVLATIAYLAGIFGLFESVHEDEFVNSGAVMWLVAQMFALWIGLGWMGLVSSALATLLESQSAGRANTER